MKQYLSAARSLVLCLSLHSCFFANACATLPHAVQVFAEPTTPNESRVNINTATASELESLPGIGSTVAARIIDYRARYGGFRRAEHLMMVRGISDKKFRELQPLITVN